MNTAPAFSVIPGSQVHDVLAGREKEVVDVVERAYRLHGEGSTVNPDSYFLRFPDRPSSRIIALPASVGGEVGVHGMKWISSFPENVAAGLPRASAVLILNDTATGYPFACLESSIISAARTAASAALAADRLARARGVRPARIGFLGTGLIARYLHDHLRAIGFDVSRAGVHDSDPAHAEGFAAYLAGHGAAAELHATSEDLVRASDLLVIATVAPAPHLTDPAWFGHHPLVLNISLRDLGPEVILGAYNVLDDVDHCLKADTSPHLAEQLVGHRGFVDGTLYDHLTGEREVPADRTVVFSPFGLGVLDLALARHVHDRLAATGRLASVPGFFHDLRRHEAPPAAG